MPNLACYTHFMEIAFRGNDYSHYIPGFVAEYVLNCNSIYVITDLYWFLLHKNEVRRIFEFYNDPIQLSFHISLCSVVQCHDALFYNYS